MGYVFISYSTKNHIEANQLRNYLIKHQIETWIAPNDIPVGSKYAQVINSAIKNCSCMILVLTNNAQNSVWVDKEVERAINYRKMIVPVQLESLDLNDAFEFYISNSQIIAVNHIDENSPEMKRVLESVASCTGAISLATPKPVLNSTEKVNNAENPNAIQKIFKWIKTKVINNPSEIKPVIPEPTEPVIPEPTMEYMYMVNNQSTSFLLSF